MIFTNFGCLIVGNSSSNVNEGSYECNATRLASALSTNNKQKENKQNKNKKNKIHCLLSCNELN
jgi:hypothetical protein